MRIFSGTIAGLTLCSLAITSPAVAQESGRITIDPRVTLQYDMEDNTDLGTQNLETEHSLSEQFQLIVKGDIADDLVGFFYGRALNIDGDAGFSDEDNDAGDTAEDAFLELRELFIEKQNLFGVVPLSVRVGRQRVREPRSIWWNSDNDLVRVNYNTTLLNAFIAAGENMTSYRTEDGDFTESDEDRFRTLGEVSWQYLYGHFLEGRFLYEDDHSGLESVGSTIDANDRDNEDFKGTWAGIRAAGEFHDAGPASVLKYRADIIGLTGEQDNLTSVAGPGNNRTVTGSTNVDVMAWAFDGSLIADPMEKGGTVVYGGYAYGSGDDNPADGDDESFRQTDIQGSSSRTGLERQQQKNYGEVLKPELSNIHVFHAGAAYPVTGATDISLTWFNYQLAEDATRLRSSGISAPLNGTDDHIGDAIDFVLNIDLDDEFDFGLPYTKDIDFRFVAGSFFPGEAYSPNDNDEAFRVFTEIKFRF